MLKKSWVLLSKDLTKMSTEFFQEAMPVGKSWKKNRHSGTMKYLLLTKLLLTELDLSLLPQTLTTINPQEPKGM